jgi:hypothetical protein
MVKSDPADREIWEHFHHEWTKLIDAELEYRKGRRDPEYCALLELIDKRDLDLDRRETRGSSTSTISHGLAFERGYLGGW